MLPINEGQRVVAGYEETSDWLIVLVGKVSTATDCTDGRTT